MPALEHLRPSPATVISTVALFVALSGTAVALTGHDTVRSDDIKNGQVKSVDIQDGGVAAADLRNGAVSSAAIQDNAVAGADVNESSLAGSQISGVDAATLGGSAAASYLKGTRLSNVVDVSPSPASQVTVLAVPGLGELQAGAGLGCNASATSSDLEYVNTTAQPVTAAESNSSGFVGDQVAASATGFAIGTGVDNGEQFNVELSTGSGASAKIANIAVWIINGGDAAAPNLSSVCRFIAEATVTP